MQATAANYPWAEELEKTVVKSLATSFGLDFLLFKDQHGGEVDTVHNVRQGVWASAGEQQAYAGRDSYAQVKDAYHKDSRYIAKGSEDAALQRRGKLVDPYTGTTMTRRKGTRDLDHTIAAKSIHDDAGRVLAGLDGIELANDESNLASTHRSINRSKQASSVDEFLAALPQRMQAQRHSLDAQRKTLQAMPRGTPQERQRIDEQQARIRKGEAKLAELAKIDPQAMRRQDARARKAYDGRVNGAYYASSKFWGSTLKASGNAGVRMGTRQMLGLMAAEIWFELRPRLSGIAAGLHGSFTLEGFLSEVRRTLRAIWTRIRARFQEFLTTFKDGVFAGVMGSATTTLFNVFATTGKNAVKIIREMWGQLTTAFKLLVFNPDKLSSADLARAVLAVLSAGAATAVGSLAYAQLVPVLSFPFGAELAAFIGALTTGVVTMGLHYFLLHSPAMQGLWAFLERSAHAHTLRQFEALNTQLDAYLADIERVEFGRDAAALETFAQSLDAGGSETEQGLLLQREAEQRGLELPFEMGNADSTRQWLASLAK